MSLQRDRGKSDARYFASDLPAFLLLFFVLWDGRQKTECPLMKGLFELGRGGLRDKDGFSAFVRLSSLCPEAEEVFALRGRVTALSEAVSGSGEGLPDSGPNGLIALTFASVWSGAVVCRVWSSRGRFLQELPVYTDVSLQRDQDSRARGILPPTCPIFCFCSSSCGTDGRRRNVLS